MNHRAQSLNVLKATGLLEPFRKEKLVNSLLKSGASPTKTDEIVAKVETLLEEGMSTKKIFKTAFKLLKNTSKPEAARYKLKQAIMELGPSGYPFEQFVAELLLYQGYNVKTGTIVKGKCISHEIDVIAEKEGEFIMVECKYHNRPGFISDVKIPLYIHSRFKDVEAQMQQVGNHTGKVHQVWWVVTNTRFSVDAEQYGLCMGLNLIGWDYPNKGSLKKLIDTYKLYPVTCLTSLTLKEKQSLLERNIVLCKKLHQNYSILEIIGITRPRLEKVINECTVLINGNNLP